VAVVDGLDDRPAGTAAVLEPPAASDGQQLIGHPAQVDFDALADDRRGL
jgi:hypothetical protein